ncbi:BTB/POZ protein [Ochromonadaceae sp. CCMP2298]|nr:BTB/POZ protein [Ochromonadaceae sp. CCMP2298]
MSNPGAPGSEAEVEELEQASKEMDADIVKLVLKNQKRKAATVSITDKARTLIAHAKQESEEIVQGAEKKAKSILAGAVEESKTLRAEQIAFVEDAKKNREFILAGAVEEINRWEAEKAALAGVQYFEPIVNLNVGGVRLTTSLTTLRRFPDTMIGCMFSGRHALPLGKDEHFFIDRDGTHFRHILNFLRSPESYKVGVAGAEKEELRRECEYYGIDQLIFPAPTEKSLAYNDLQSGTPGVINAATHPEVF